MELFDSDNEEESRNDALSSYHNSICIELLRLKPQVVSSTSPIVSMNRKIALLKLPVGEEECCGLWQQLLSRLTAAKMDVEPIDLISPKSCFDIVIVPNWQMVIVNKLVECLSRCLIPGGKCFLPNDISFNENEIFRSSLWALNTSPHSNLRVLQRRAVPCNTLGAPYWGTPGQPFPNERELLEQITVTLSVEERRVGLVSAGHHQQAVHSLRDNGICIFRGMFNRQNILEWGLRAKEDMKLVIDRLADRNIDLFEPREGQWIENYHEMSMREARRVDLRNGLHMKEKQQLPQQSLSQLQASSEVDNGTVSSQATDMRNHPSLYQILQEVMNPPGGEDSRGNWGRYNFEGGGPDAGPPPLTVGPLACVMSMTGCADQTIHADTSHTYVHVELPGHYYNLFSPAVDAAVTGDDGGEEEDRYYIGQTAFVCGSHLLKIAADVMVREGGQAVLENHLIRPQLQPGDALLFDCRILHFGLANQPVPHTNNNDNNCNSINCNNVNSYSKNNSINTSGWRPMLYVNYHQSWFHDPKNWNDAVKLFP